VLLSELVLVLAVYLYRHSRPSAWLMLIYPGLIYVDYIHFQYNGFLMGVLLLSTYCIEHKRPLLGAGLFAGLLCFKHIFLYAAPAYFFFLLKHYVNKSPLRLAKLASVVLLVFSVAFLPFVSQVPQILKRLFPFGRGLTHAYWAPNIWALYNFIDLGLSAVLKRKFSTEFTLGLVHDPSHAVLLNVRPGFVLLLSVWFSVWLGVKIWKDATSKRFLEYVSISCFGWFMLGWHVHEKAVLMFVLPLLSSSIVPYGPLAFYANLCLLPLIPTPLEHFFMLSSHLVLSQQLISHNKLALSQFCSSIPVILTYYFADSLLGKQTFLPLLAVSVYCAIGLVSSSRDLGRVFKAKSS